MTGIPTVDRPTVLGEYEIIKQLGQGGMGTVYQARHFRLKRLAAVKVLSSAVLNDAGARERFLREAEAVGCVDHPNLVRAYDACETDGVPYLVMEYLEGEDLAHALRRLGCLPPTEACGRITQALAGLRHAHEHGLVHRDLKPSNLMLVANNADSSLPNARAGRSVTVKVLDLGLARFVSAASAQLTASHEMMGTPDYMAPEQFTSAHDVDARADVYSLGCTLYHMLAGQPPFPGRSLTKKMAGHLLEEPAPLEELCEDLPPGLGKVVARMMAKNPEDRFPTATAAAAALAPYATPARVPLSAPGALPSSRNEAPETARAWDRTLCPSARDRTRRKDSVAARRPATPRATKPRARTRRRLWAAAILLVVAGLAAVPALYLAGVLFKVRTASGTLVVEVDQPGAEVFVNGKHMTITPSGESEPVLITVEEGRHQLTVLKGGFETYTREFTWKVGDTTPIKVRLEPVPTTTAKSPAAPTRDPEPPPEPGPKRQPAAPLPPAPRPVEKVEKIDLTGDVAELDRHLRSGRDSAVMIRRVGPERLAAWRAAAEQGGPEGQYFLARCLELGVGVEKNAAAAVSWYRKAADQRYAVAQLALGVCYEFGTGVAKDAAEAVKWYRKAADQGDAWPRPTSAGTTSPAQEWRRTPPRPSSGITRPPIKGMPGRRTTSASATRRARG
jgi:serine/threonine protein kinase